jgi:hypothetical protein
MFGLTRQALGILHQRHVFVVLLMKYIITFACAPLWEKHSPFLSNDGYSVKDLLPYNS